MRNRMLKLGAALSALTAFAVGGAQLATAGHKANPPAPAPAPAPSVPAAPETTDAQDTDTVQQGDQSAPDLPEASGAESSSESETGPSDGPGGYADSSPNADTQQTGEH